MQTKKTKLELLAPAKNLSTGIVAINAGADAVYIGAQKFGARSEAGNNLDDIRALIKYAHQFSVKVYVAFNTIIFDNELKEAEQLIKQIYEAKADGLIVQDMGILKMNLPPISLIASTQMHNYELEKIKFLEQIGFKRVILARELSKEQIQEIRSKTNLELETFIQGALCVSFSGRCYLSEALAKRSANRGQCIQACRLPYSLIDSDGKVLAKNKYLLSLKDFNLSENLEQLIDLGVTSFKIEGRLKDEDYVSNVVCYYRKKIDEIIAKRKDLKKASVGNVLVDFIPNLEKTFNRGFTDYFFNQRNKDILAINSPKSIGKFVGIAKDIFKNSFILDGKEKISNGDGLCFLNKQGDLTGSNVNKVEGSKIFLNEMNGLISGAKIYRNFDIQFNKQIKLGAPKRRIPVVLSFLEIDNGFSLIAEDEDGNKVSLDFPTEKQEAQNKAAAENIIISQLSKTGETIFSIQEIKILWKNQYFLKVSLLNEMRRNILKMLLEERINNYKVEQFQLKESQVPFIAKELNYESNAANKLARMFYEKHGVLKIEPAFELTKERQGKKIMTTKHCLKYYFGYCTKTNKTTEIKEPLYLVNEKGQKFLLKFDCAKCQMEVLLPK